MITDADGLEIVRQTAARHPHLLAQNTNATCFQFVRLVLAQLPVEWGHVGKTAGEGRYTPDDFKPRDLTGRDGKAYTITGVSHDAIFDKDNNRQVDILGRGNDAPEPIRTPDGVLSALPQWSPIDPTFYRPNNPWVSRAYNGGLVTPQPQPPTVKAYPGDEFFRDHIGKPLEADYKTAKQTLNAGSAVWFSRTIWRYLHQGMSIEESIKVSQREWREILGNSHFQDVS